jgi:Plasmid pRiA4b ORF-3-like protein
MSDRLFAMFARLPSVGEALALRVTLRHIEPAIWRTLVVPAETSLGELHEVLQIVFGWHNSHLHDFEVGGIRLGMADVEDDMFVVDEQAAPLGAVAGEGTSFTYRYDFGDDWHHDVVVEGVVANGAEGFACQGGARACPPEDCGGPPGYDNLLRVLADPAHAEFRGMKKWVGSFDPEHFALDAVNKRLATLSKRLARGRK